MVNSWPPGEGERSPEQPGIIDLPDEDGQVPDGQSDPVPGEICKLFLRTEGTLSVVFEVFWY